MAHSPKTSQGGVSLPSKVRPRSMKTVQPMRSQPPAWQWRWKQSPMLSTGLYQEMTTRLRMPSSSATQWACYKKWKVECMEWPDIHFRKLLRMCCVGHARMKLNDRPDRLQAVCVSENLKCWGAWNTTCGNSSRDITKSISLRREAWEEETLDDLPWEDERGPSSIRWTLKLSMVTMGKFLRDGWSAYILGAFPDK